MSGASLEDWQLLWDLDSTDPPQLYNPSSRSMEDVVWDWPIVWAASRYHPKHVISVGAPSRSNFLRAMLQFNRKVRWRCFFNSTRDDSADDGAQRWFKVLGRITPHCPKSIPCGLDLWLSDLWVNMHDEFARQRHLIMARGQHKTLPLTRWAFQRLCENGLCVVKNDKLPVFFDYEGRSAFEMSLGYFM